MKECVVLQAQRSRAGIDAAGKAKEQQKQGRGRKGGTDVKNVKQQERGRRKRDKKGTEEQGREVKR
jgi:hypothetical protein